MAAPDFAASNNSKHVGTDQYQRLTWWVLHTSNNQQQNRHKWGAQVYEAGVIIKSHHKKIYNKKNNHNEIATPASNSSDFFLICFHPKPE